MKMGSLSLSLPSSMNSSHHVHYHSYSMIKTTTMMKRAVALVALGLIWAVSTAATSQGYVVVPQSVSSAAVVVVKTTAQNHRVSLNRHQNPRTNGATMTPVTASFFQSGAKTTSRRRRRCCSSSSSLSVVVTATTTRGGGSGSERSASAVATQVRMARSVVVACTCMATHLLIATKSLSLSPIQASSLVALAVCGANNAHKLPPATAAAALCGTFAGMSAHIGASVAAAASGHRTLYYYCYAAALLVYSALAGLAYHIWDAFQISVGVGGRLGVMALCGNAVYTALFVRSALQSTLQQMVTSSTLWPGLVAASTGALALVRRWKASSQSLVGPKVLQVVSKLAVVSLLLVRLVGNPLDRTVLIPFLAALAAVLAACTIVQRSPGTVVPTAIVGLVGSTLVQPIVSALLGGTSFDVAAPLYMGAILGMTAPSKLTKVQFAQAATVATTLLQLSLWSGYGGRLGLFALAGVYFAM
jgi:hypothetical protein